MAGVSGGAPASDESRQSGTSDATRRAAGADNPAKNGRGRQADAGRNQRNSRLERRELDINPTPRSGGGETEPQHPELRGQRNQEGVGNLVSGDKTLMESPERGAASNRTLRVSERQNRGTGITNRGDEGQSQVMKGRGNMQASGRGDVNRPEHQPGATGRPMNRRSPGTGGDLDTGNAGAMAGTNRSVKLTNKKRKNKAA